MVVTADTARLRGMNFWRAVAEKSTGTMFETPRPTTVNPASEAHAHGAATTSPNPAAAHRLPYRRTRASPSACTMRSPNRRPIVMATEKHAKARPAREASVPRSAVMNSAPQSRMVPSLRYMMKHNTPIRSTIPRGTTNNGVSPSLP